MTDELDRLLKEKEELERKIRMLTDGAVFNDNAKIDMIRYPGAQNGKWALSYKYSYIEKHGRMGVPVQRNKWNTLFYGSNREEVVMKIPDIIRDLMSLYEKARGDSDGGTA